MFRRATQLAQSCNRPTHPIVPCHSKQFLLVSRLVQEQFAKRQQRSQAAMSILMARRICAHFIASFVSQVSGGSVFFSTT